MKLTLEFDTDEYSGLDLEALKEFIDNPKKYLNAIWRAKHRRIVCYHNCENCGRSLEIVKNCKCSTKKDYKIIAIDRLISDNSYNCIPCKIKCKNICDCMSLLNQQIKVT